MNSLINILNTIVNDKDYKRIRRIIDLRVKHFKEIGKSSIKRKFIELSFCLLTANYRADRAIRIQKIIWDGFLYMPLPDLRDTLRRLGYRYPNRRAEFIVEARDKIHDIEEIINSDLDLREKRIRLVRLVKGLGVKEASHFLRNIGYDDIAIIDRHVMNLLSRYEYIDRKSNLNRREYIEIEEILKEIGYSLGLELSKLDLYLWYLTTGTIMK
jgi:N-glycosylase/DNA lyase